MSAQLRQEEIDELRAAFDSFDADGSGSISHDELAKMLTQISPHQRLTKDQIILMVKTFDKNGNNQIDFQEFMDMMLSVQRNKDDELSDVFSFFDKDNSGTITAEEIMNVMRSLGERVTLEECQLMVKSVDVDGSGNIDKDEFFKMMRNGFEVQHLD